METLDKYSHIAEGSTDTAGDIPGGDITAERGVADAGDCPDVCAIAGDA